MLTMSVLLACLTQVFLVFGQGVGDARRQVLFPESDSNSREETLEVVRDQANHCTTEDVAKGTCIDFDRCPQFTIPRPNFQALHRNLCGFNGELPLVCCPNPEPRVLLEPGEGTTVTNNHITSNQPRLLPTDCGHTNATLRRVVHGEEAEPGAWPWLGALYIEQRGISSSECGSSLISERYVMTAAHCVTDDRGQIIPARQLTVRLGDHHLFSSEDGAKPVDMAVASVTRHPQFQLSTFLNDIALLRLERTAQMNDFVQPVCLPYDSPLRTNDLEGLEPFVAGWGTTSFDGPASSVVQHVQLPVWNATACRNAYRGRVNLTSVYLCAGYADGVKDACQGDSGGPLMVSMGQDKRFHQIGIVSFGKGCAEPGFPGVYTNVREFLPWIAENIH